MHFKKEKSTMVSHCHQRTITIQTIDGDMEFLCGSTMVKVPMLQASMHHRDMTL